MSVAPPTFRFLSGRQVLSLDKLVARQVLSVAPEERSPTSGLQDGALIYIVVSHRWDKENSADDESGTPQL